MNKVEVGNLGNSIENLETKKSDEDDSIIITFRASGIAYKISVQGEYIFLYEDIRLTNTEISDLENALYLQCNESLDDQTIKIITEYLSSFVPDNI